MDVQPSGPDEAFARELAQLDRELQRRSADQDGRDIPVKTVDLLAGLIAGMAHVGRPAR